MSIKLQVGKTYRDRSGDIIKIEEKLNLETRFQFVSDTSRTFTIDGMWAADGGDSEYDLIEEIAASAAIPEEDEVNHPSHYTQGSIECIAAIKAALTPEEFRGYCKGNMLKYIWRERHKQGDVAIEKALWYGDKLLEG